MEAEKRIRREIANSNERRRMQSINAGFQALRTLLPRHEGEKLSKVCSILIRNIFECLFTTPIVVLMKIFLIYFTGCHLTTDSRIYLFIGTRKNETSITELSVETVVKST